MTTIIDIGAAKYGGDFSIERLIAEFKPEVIWAFDPHPSMPDAFDGEAEDATTVHLRGEAAWTYDGEVGFFSDGLNSKIDLEGLYDWPKVPCFDLARFIKEIVGGSVLTRSMRRADPGGTLVKVEKFPRVILKLDAETSEYPLLEHLIRTGTDEMLELVWVEWHCLSCGRGGGGHRANCKGPTGESRRREIEKTIACEIKEWNW